MIVENVTDISLNEEVFGGWGFIDKKGNEVIPCMYDYAFDFSEGYAAVMLGGKGSLSGKWGFIDKTGKPLLLKN